MNDRAREPKDRVDGPRLQQFPSLNGFELARAVHEFADLFARIVQQAMVDEVF